ncbi:MAG TPA: tetraacyldisaccharide 4'-kinase [Chitinispirillaceae bacterium]|nr:tetraacyldisaccharide 4'-kinase [Chitinispirillaceae bacterium]
MSTEIQTPLPQWISNSALSKIISKIYNLAIQRRNLRFENDPSLSYQSIRPVISIGGIRAGGTGKTPLSMHIAQYLISQDLNVALLSRGYKRAHKEDRIVLPFEKADWELIGDEPAMLHNNIPQSFLAVSSNRVRSAQKLEQLAPSNTVFLLDDGFQHRKIKRDMDIVCLNETILSDKLIPCGYLREPLESLNRAKALVLMGSSERLPLLQDIAIRLNKHFMDIPVFVAVQSIDCWVNASTGAQQNEPPFKKPVAFCGIARPHRFFELLKAQGVYPVREIRYPDHHRFTKYDIESIHKLYSHGLVTTEKDAFRLMNNNFVPELKLWYLKIKLRFEPETSLNRFNKLINNVALNI